MLTYTKRSRNPVSVGMAVGPFLLVPLLIELAFAVQILFALDI